MISLDPDSGEERWRFDPKNETPPYSLFGNCRGVTYYKLEDVADGAQCKERIFTATTDARLIAVDKDTGLPCEDFGNDGQISLLAGMGEVKPYYYFVTSPATVASGVLVVGGWVMDNQEVEEHLEWSAPTILRPASWLGLGTLAEREIPKCHQTASPIPAARPTCGA